MLGCRTIITAVQWFFSMRDFVISCVLYLGYCNFMVDRNTTTAKFNGWVQLGTNVASLATFAFIALANHFDTKAELLFGSNRYIISIIICILPQYKCCLQTIKNTRSMIIYFEFYIVYILSTTCTVNIHVHSELLISLFQC